MNTEKIKQMGRDYYKAHGITLEIPSRDDAFWNAWNGSEPETTLKGDKQEAEYTKWKDLWYEGFKEAMNSENTALRAHAERLAEALEKIVEIEDGDGMAVIGWTDALYKADQALTLYRAENPKV